LLHLVYQNRKLLYAQHMYQEGMPSRLFPDALICGHNQHSHIGMRSAGEHVLDEFLVAGHIGDSIEILPALKHNSRGIYGTLFFQLVVERVNKIGKLKPLLVLFGQFLYFLHPPLGNALGVIKQPADQSRFAMVHMSYDYYIYVHSSLLVKPAAQILNPNT
jgi:hypothetical protein